MSAPLRHFFSRHPILRDTLLWAIPALIVGAILRLLFLSYLPYALWGADSRSYYSFAHKLIGEFYISLDAKRRYVYPFFLVPISLLPGAPARWVAVLQHLLGVATLLPIAYAVRKTCVHWRLWIVPVTVLFSSLPVVVWYEHELLGETIFFAALTWTFAGWIAWLSEERQPRAARLFWWFFVPLALFLLTKPSGRFVWAGVAVGLVLTGAWRRLERRHFAALGALFLATLTVGSGKQGAWLLYTAVFPLTQLDTPLHAEYKAQIRDLVEPLAQNPDTYYLLDDVPFEFLDKPRDHPERPLWAALESDEKRQAKIYMDLALEAIRARPFAFLYFGVQRAVASSNLSEFGLNRFKSDYHRQRFEQHYEDAQRLEKGAIRLAFAFPRQGALPSYEQFANRLDPVPGSWQESVVRAWVGAVGSAIDFFKMPEYLPKPERKFWLVRPTFLGCWLGAAALLTALPGYRRTLGVWTILTVGYVMGVFLISQTNARYFAPAWPVVIVLLAVPADVLVSSIVAAVRRK